ncbi:MAG: rhomboid family intramembrane serine protease [Actinomycetota bacterium]|nr:rhomboid family intramembrane serine protease [Actinomycetota bacterium]
MFPLRDINPTRITPWVTLSLIAASLVVYFFAQQQGGFEEQQIFLYERATIACEVTTGAPLSFDEIFSGECMPGAQPPAVPEKIVLLSVLTAMFLHGGPAHVLFNMWFLWIFGNNVEDAYGHFWYLVMYMVGGVFATMTYVLMNAGSTIPLVGASGAIAVALGAYGVLFPRHKVLSLVGWFVVPVPAVIFLAVWFFIQFGLGGTGTAWEAHVGGFVFGAVITLALRSRLLARI